MSTFQNFDDIQAYEKLETERQTTMNDPKYQQWIRELKVSQSYVEPEGAIRAKFLNEQYDFSNATTKSPIVNFLKLKGLW